MNMTDPMQPVPAASKWGTTSMGLDPQTGAGLAYLSLSVAGFIVPVIFFVIEKRNRFLRFHAAQALLLSIMPVVAAAVLALLAMLATVLSAAVGGTPSAETFGMAMAIGAVLFALLMVAYFVLWVWGMVAGFSGSPTRFPLLGGLAERMAGGPPVPAF